MNQIKLDLKDKKLLKELDLNGRATYSELAKKIGLSKQGVEYKLTNLIEKKVIGGFYPIINSSRLGFKYCRFVFSFKNTTQEIEKEIFSYLKSQEEIFWIFSMQGIFDVGMAVWTKSILEFQETIRKFLFKYGKYIKDKHEDFPTDVIHYEHRFLLNEPETKEIHLLETNQTIQIDETDKKILKKLCENARKPLVEIANELEISAKVVSYRIKKMENEKIIEGYRPILNYQTLEHTYYKLWISVNYESMSEINKLYQYIKYNPKVLYVVKGVGFIEDLDIELVIKNNFELFEFIKDLKQKFPTLIGDYKSVMFVDTIKVKYLPF